MTKREADIILLACKKHNLSLKMRKEGDIYFVTFSSRLEIQSFEAAKSITNGLVIENRNKKHKKESLGLNHKPKAIEYSKYPKTKSRPDNSVGFAERHGGG